VTDQEREQLIEAWRQILIMDPDEMAKRAAELRMRNLIANRTLERVRQMEIERGLRCPS